MKPVLYYQTYDDDFGFDGGYIDIWDHFTNTKYTYWGYQIIEASWCYKELYCTYYQD